MCVHVFVRHKKTIWLLLLIAVVASLVGYLIVLAPPLRESREISRLRAKYEAHTLVALGALGKPAAGNWSVDERLEAQRSRNETGFNAWLSQRIPGERTLFDMRHRRCKKLRYPVDQLGNVSVVITYHNEESSVLLRTLHSLRNRTPRHLLQHIILVDDGSVVKQEDREEFSNYLRWKFGDLVRQLHLPKQLGLMRARMAGARATTQTEILIFLDAHVEVTESWLPPLITPILGNNKTCTTPIIDTIDYETFAYKRGKPSRGFFDWYFNYIQLPLLPSEEKALPAPHNNPIMNGGLFAISRDWFFELGGYDDGLRIWGGEQIELSLKLWLCGGRILEVPCSRVGHLFRDGDYQVRYTHRKNERKAVDRNYKRIAEVWLDVYKDKLYANVPALTYVKVGALREQKTLRQRLKCKPFKWFLDHLGKDFLAKYPLVDPPDFAFGALQSTADPKLCVDRANKKSGQPELLKCGTNDLRFPELNQKWTLTPRRDLRSSYLCLELREHTPNAPIWLWQCHGQEGNQFWSYNATTKLLVQGKDVKSERCLEAQLEERRVVANICDLNNVKQRWEFGYVNTTALQQLSLSEVIKS